jgi:hypothetical protein
MAILLVPESIPYIGYIRHFSKNFPKDVETLDSFGYEFGLYSTSRYDLYYDRKGSYKTVKIFLELIFLYVSLIILGGF